jgi:hypothetical protein
MRSRSSIVVVTTLWTGQSEIRILAGARDFSLFFGSTSPAVGPPSLLFHRYSSSVLGVKQPGCEFDHKPLSST